MRITITKLIRSIIFWIILGMLLTQCTRPRFVLDGYVVIDAQPLAVVKYTPDHPEGKKIYQLYAAGTYPRSNYAITAVAYDPEKKLIAIAQENAEPQRGTAVIKILDEITSSVVKEIATKKDRIYGMSIDKEGRLAFATGDMYFAQPGELCYLSLTDGIVHTIAKGAHFSFPAWSKDSKRVYFSYNYEDHTPTRIAYVELANPYAIKEIADGNSVSVSDNGKVAYLTKGGDIMFVPESNDVSTQSRQLLRHVDPIYTFGIRFVKGSEDIVLVHSRKMALELRVLRPPYKKEKIMVPSIGTGDFETAYIKYESSQ